MGRPQLNLAQAGNEPAGALLRYHHRKVFGFRRERHDGAEWDRNGRVRDFTQTDRSDHARLQMTVAIADSHFNREDSVSRIGGWSDACNPPLLRGRILLCLDAPSPTYTHAPLDI